ncbi:MAG: cell division FtsZ family protein [Prevotellaceae bacterium]|nr:cell division FtsZ family protein [Prevotellaceae bacterium]
MYSKSVPPSDEPIVQFADDGSESSAIKVIGVGGGGGNAVANMYTGDFGAVNRSVQFFVCNTDAKALDDSPVPHRVRIGHLGVGGIPAAGREAAETHIEEIRRVLDEKTRMIFITAGMGGGTGTGASPVIAREARTRGILTVSIVTLPFLWEGKCTIDKALDGLESLEREVDALLIINNQRLLEIYPEMPVLGGFRRADETLSTAVRSIVEIIQMHGTVNLDFHDVETCLRGGGRSIMSIGSAAGDGRITRALDEALHSPLLNSVDVYKAGRVLIKITHSAQPDCGVRNEELSEIHHFFSRFSTDYEMKYGIDSDDTLGERVKIVLLASDIGAQAAAVSERTVEQAFRAAEYYGAQLAPRRATNVFLFEPGELDDVGLCERVDSHPAYGRTRRTLETFRNQ